MTSYRTDKTSRIVLALFIAYCLGYGVARAKVLRLLRTAETGGARQYIVNIETTTAGGWEYNVFWPAVKLEETARSIVKEIGSYF